MQSLGLPVGMLLTPAPAGEVDLPRSAHAPAGCGGCHALLNRYCRVEAASGRWWCSFCGEETSDRRDLTDALVRQLCHLHTLVISRAAGTSCLWMYDSASKRIWKLMTALCHCRAAQSCTMRTQSTWQEGMQLLQMPMPARQWSLPWTCALRHQLSSARLRWCCRCAAYNLGQASARAAR